MSWWSRYAVNDVAREEAEIIAEVDVDFEHVVVHRRPYCHPMGAHHALLVLHLDTNRRTHMARFLGTFR